MQITIKLFATLRKGRFDINFREIPPNTTIKEIINDLGIPEDQAAIIFVNSRHAKLDQKLYEGDIVAFFPPVGGG